MARPNEVWFRKDIGCWMVTVDAKKNRLAEGRSNRKVAEQKFHELKAVQARPAERSDARVADVIDRFLGWSKLHRSFETNRNHIWYGQKFSEHIDYLKATELRPHYLTQWVDSRSWGQTTQRNPRRSINRAFARAVDEESKYLLFMAQLEQGTLIRKVDEQMILRLFDDVPRRERTLCFSDRMN